MLAIYKKELKSFFRSSKGYIFLAMYSFVLWATFIFRLGGGGYGLFSFAEIVLYFGSILFGCEAVKEFNSNLKQLTFSLPIKTTSMILGKFFAYMSFCLITVVIEIVYLNIIFFGENFIWNEFSLLFVGWVYGALMAAFYFIIGFVVGALTNKVGVAVYVLVFFNFVFYGFVVDIAMLLCRKYNLKLLEKIGRNLLVLKPVESINTSMFDTKIIIIGALQISALVALGVYLINRKRWR